MTIGQFVSNLKNLAVVDSNRSEAQTKYSFDSTPAFLINRQAHGPMLRAEWKKTRIGWPCKADGPPALNRSARSAKTLTKD